MISIVSWLAWLASVEAHRTQILRVNGCGILPTVIDRNIYNKIVQEMGYSKCESLFEKQQPHIDGISHRQGLLTSEIKDQNGLQYSSDLLKDFHAT